MISFLLLLWFFLNKPAFASDIIVTCPNDPSNQPSELSCQLNNSDPLFSESNISPGFLSQENITVENLDTDNPCFLKAETIKNSGDDLLLEGTDRLNLSIISNSSLLYSGPLIFTNLNLGQVDISSTRNYYWTVSFPVSAGNDYQNLSANFDINLNFICADNPTWQPSVTNPTSGVYLSEFMPQTPEGDEWVEIYNNNSFPVNLTKWRIKDDPTNKNPPKVFDASIPAKSFFVINFAKGYLNDNGTDYVVLISDIGTTIESVSYSGSSTTKSWSKQTDGLWCQTSITKGCANDPCPGVAAVSSSISVSAPSSSPPTACTDPKPATPTGLSITSDINTATLSWDPVSPPLTSYLIAFGPSADNILYGNPNIGLSTSYTVGGLTSGAQYCFYVRAQNGCMPGDASQTVCINTGSNIPIVETEPPAGFQPQVLGEITEIPQINQTTIEEDLNLGDILGDSTSSCTTLYIPILFILAFILNSLIFLKNSDSNLFLSFLISLTTFVIDYFLLQKFCCRISFLCRFYFIGNIISFILPKLIFNFKNNVM